MSLIQKRYILVLASLATLLAVAGIAKVVYAHRTQSVTVPDRTPIRVTLDQAVASDLNRAGDHFTATVSEPVLADNKTVIPEGAHVEGVIVDAHPSGRLMGRARLQLALAQVEVGGKEYEIHSLASGGTGLNHKKRNWAWIGGGAVGGTLIGAAAAGGKGALIGGPIGAGGGTAAAFLTGKRDIHLRPETELTFRLAEPLTLEVRE